MLVPILIGIIFVMAFCIAKQREYIKVIEKISEQKSHEIEVSDKLISSLISKDDL